MTDYSELVERMRAYPANRLCVRVADALEAQAKRIATLEELRNEYRRAINLLKEDTRVRIAELENLTRRLNQECNAEFVRSRKLEAENKALRAALKPFADRYGEITKMVGGVTQDYALLTVDVGFGDLCTAHAALKGEM